MRRKILVAYDGSLLSRHAIQEAKYQAAQDSQSEVHVFSSLQTAGPTTNVGVSRSISRDLMERYQPQLEKVKEEFEKENITAFSRIQLIDQNENPGKSICEYAENQGIDLIIMGSRGLGNVKKLFLGSVSNNVVQNARCPVLIVK